MKEAEEKQLSSKTANVGDAVFSSHNIYRGYTKYVVIGSNESGLLLSVWDSVSDYDFISYNQMEVDQSFFIEPHKAKTNDSIFRVPLALWVVIAVIYFLISIFH